MASQALKDEVMQAIDKMSDGRTKLVLSYAKRLESEQKSQYGKFKTAAEYEEAKKLWEEFESLCIKADLPEDYDYKEEIKEAKRRKYESLN